MSLETVSAFKDCDVDREIGITRKPDQQTELTALVTKHLGLGGHLS